MSAEIKPPRNRVKQKTVVEQVMQEIKEYITRESLRPDEKLPSESDLASMFNISRSSIREALKIFQYLGIVQAAGPKGNIITSETKIATETLNWSLLLASPSYQDLLELRLVMEEQGLWYLEVFRKDDQNLVNAIIDNLKKEVENMKSIESLQVLEHRLNADFNFHEHIVKVCKNPVFDSVYSNLKSLMLNYLLTNPSKKEKMIADPESHQQLIKIIENGNYTETLNVFRTHSLEAAT